MRCQLAALCDAANVSANGKINLLGEFDTVFAATLPAVHPLMVFVAKLKLLEADIGTHAVNLRVVDEDMQIVQSLDGEMRMGAQPIPGLESGFPMMLQIVNAEFRAFGTYTFELRVDNRVLCELPLHVREVPGQ